MNKSKIMFLYLGILFAVLCINESEGFAPPNAGGEYSFLLQFIVMLHQKLSLRWRFSTRTATQHCKKCFVTKVLQKCLIP